MRKIEVDVNKKKSPFPQHWKRCVGSERAGFVFRKDYQDHLDTVQKEIGFEYIRFHGLFHDDMNVYRIDRKGNEVISWMHVDICFDALLSKGIKPLVEISFMPKDLISGEKTVFWWKANITPPKDYAKWEKLIDSFIRHLLERYGTDEVRSWYFEVWNEPNLKDLFWAGTQEEYFHLYERTANIIKKIDSNLKVGGPATAGSAWVPEFIDFCRKGNVPMDFISTHSYSVRGNFDQGDSWLAMIPEKDFLWKEIQSIKAQIQSTSHPHLPLFYTEWSTSFSSRDPVHDHYISAPFIIHTLAHTAEAAPVMSYWTFTDVFEEEGPCPSPFHGGFGLVNNQGFKKPSYYAYQLLARMKGELVEQDDSQTIVSAQEEKISLMTWDLTLFKQDTSNREFFIRDLPPANTNTIPIILKGLKNGKKKITTYRIGYRSNDIFAHYFDMGCPVQLSKEQFAKLQSVNQLTAESSKEVEVQGNTFEANVELRSNDLLYLEISDI